MVHGHGTMVLVAVFDERAWGASMPTDEERGLAIVTGAATGIGRAAALRLASDGYSVACLDIDADNAKNVAANIISRGGRAMAAHMDVRVADQVANVFGMACAEFGPPRALVRTALP